MHDLDTFHLLYVTINILYSKLKMYVILCGVFRESILHCRVYCSFAQGCWHQAGFYFADGLVSSFSSWLEYVLHHFSSADAIQVVMLSWALWKVQNDLVWKGSVARVSAVLYLANITLHNWQKAQRNQPTQFAEFLEDKDGSCVWVKPRTSSVKLNVDAAIFLDQGLFSLAGIARNSKGEFSGCFFKLPSG